MTTPLDLACPASHASAGRYCDPVARTCCEARIDAADNEARGRAAWAAHHADAALLAAARCFPPGYLAEVAAILTAGGKRHGCEPHETGGGQSIDDHLQHALDHLHAVDHGLMHGRDVKPDRDSGRSQFAHAGARTALGWGLERAAAEGGGQ